VTLRIDPDEQGDRAPMPAPIQGVDPLIRTDPLPVKCPDTDIDGTPCCPSRPSYASLYEMLDGCTPITQASNAIRPALDLGTLERSARRVSDLCSHGICFNGP
jgi:hypothetical protein